MRIWAQWLFGNLGQHPLEFYAPKDIGFTTEARKAPEVLEFCCGEGKFYEFAAPELCCPVQATRTKKQRQQEFRALRASVVNKPLQMEELDFPWQPCRISEKRDRIINQGKTFRSRSDAARFPPAVRRRCSVGRRSWFQLEVPEIPKCFRRRGWIVRCRWLSSACRK